MFPANCYAHAWNILILLIVIPFRLTFNTQCFGMLTISLICFMTSKMKVKLMSLYYGKKNYYSTRLWNYKLMLFIFIWLNITYNVTKNNFLTDCYFNRVGIAYLSEHMKTSLVFSLARVAQYSVFCVMFCR